jgi:hypothetical protein
VVIALEAEQVSGALLAQGFSLVLQDEMGNIVVTDNSTIATMVALSNDTTLMKDKSVTAVNGVITFESVIIVAAPGTVIYLEIQADSIDNTKIAKVYPYLVNTTKTFVT